MKQPESIILAFANISKQYLDHLNFELHEIRDNALRNAERGNYIRVIEHNGTTYHSLSNLLNSDKGKDVTMLHYSGHSSGKGLWVQWQDQDGIIKTEPLANLFHAHKKFRFVFLNSCCSEDIAKELIDGGVPYVIGTTERIKDKAAAIVASQFYKFLSGEGKTIREAFNLTRYFFANRFYQENAVIREAFRSMESDDGPEDEYPWRLFESPALKKENKDWVLIPSKERNLVLSSHKGNDIKLRVFCIYEGEACTKLYKVTSTHFDNDKAILIHGLDEISPGDVPNEEDVIAECKNADVVLHLLSDAKYVTLWKERLDRLTDLCRQKYNIAIAAAEDFEIPADFLRNNNITFYKALPEPIFELKSLENIKNAFKNRSLYEICQETKVFENLKKSFSEIINEKEPNGRGLLNVGLDNEQKAIPGNKKLKGKFLIVGSIIILASAIILFQLFFTGTRKGGDMENKKNDDTVIMREPLVATSYDTAKPPGKSQNNTDKTKKTDHKNKELVKPPVNEDLSTAGNVNKEPAKPRVNDDLSIAGNVFDEDGKPLKDVKLIISGVSTSLTTDENGGFHFTFDSNQPKNEFTITYIREGYETYTDTDVLPKHDIKISLKANK